MSCRRKARELLRRPPMLTDAQALQRRVFEFAMLRNMPEEARKAHVREQTKYVRRKR